MSDVIPSVENTATILEATPADIETIIRFTLKLAAQMGQLPNQHLVRRGVTRFISNQEHGRYFLAFADDAPCGQIIIKPVIYEPWKKSRVIWVDDFYVDPDRKDASDLMTALLKHGINWALLSESHRVIRCFCPHNHPSMMLALLRLGFRPIGIMMQQRQDYFFEEDINPPCEIRAATPSDAYEILKMTEELARHLDAEPDQLVTQEGLEHFLANERYGRYFLASSQGQLLGQMVFKPVLFEPWKNSHIIWIDDAYVRPAGRRCNITKALLKHGINWSMQNEFEGIVRLYCSFKNESGLASWLSLGFEPIGYMMQHSQYCFL